MVCSCRTCTDCSVYLSGGPSVDPQNPSPNVYKPSQRSRTFDNKVVGRGPKPPTHRSSINKIQFFLKKKHPIIHPCTGDPTGQPKTGRRQTGHTKVCAQPNSKATRGQQATYSPRARAAKPLPPAVVALGESAAAGGGSIRQSPIPPYPTGGEKGRFERSTHPPTGPPPVTGRGSGNRGREETCSYRLAESRLRQKSDGLRSRDSSIGQSRRLESTGTVVHLRLHTRGGGGGGEEEGDGEAGGGVNLRTSGRGAGERHLRLTEVSAWMSLCVCVGSFLRSFSKLCNRQLTTRFLFFCPIYTSSALACLLALAGIQLCASLSGNVQSVSD